MNLSVNTMTPFIEDLIEKTKSNQYIWDSMGKDSYCLVAGGYSYAIKSQSGFIPSANDSQLTFQFFDKKSCIFEYSPTFFTNNEKFSQLVIQLMEVVSAQYAEALREKAQNAMNALNNKKIKNHEY